MLYLIVKTSPYNDEYGKVAVTDARTGQKNTYSLKHFITSMQNAKDRAYILNGRAHNTYVYTYNDWLNLNMWRTDFGLKRNDTELGKIKLLEMSPEFDNDGYVVNLPPKCILCDGALILNHWRLICKDLTIIGSEVPRVKWDCCTQYTVKADNLTIHNPYALGCLCFNQRVTFNANNSVNIMVPYLGLELVEDLYDILTRMLYVPDINIKSSGSNPGILGNDLDALYTFVVKTIDKKLRRLSVTTSLLTRYHATLQLCFNIFKTTGDSRYVELISIYGKEYLKALDIHSKQKHSTNNISEYVYNIITRDWEKADRAVIALFK